METEKPIISQKEYLKRYLSKDKSKKKKKKEKISSSSHLKRSVIIDDDLGLKDVANVDDEEFNLDYLGDEAPQIAGIVDERPAELRAKEKYSNSLWRDMDEGNKEDNSQHTIINESKLTEMKSNHMNDSDSDLSLPRSEKKNQNQEPIHSQEKDTRFKENFRKRNNDSHQLPKRKYSSNRNSDSDMSPPRSSKNNEIDFQNKNFHHAKTNKYSKEISDSEDSKKSNVKNGDNPRRRNYEIVDRQNNYTVNYEKNKKFNEGKKNSERYTSYYKNRYFNTSSKYKEGKQDLLIKSRRKEHSDSDQSPDRNRYQKKKDISEKLKRKEYAADSDLLPTRDIYQKRKNPEKLRRKNFRGNDDLSPERIRYQKSDVPEKLRRKQYGSISDTDSSSARDRAQKRKESTQKLKTKETGGDSDSDLSPIRGHSQKRKDVSEKSKRREQRVDSDSDLPPERDRYPKAKSMTEKKRKAHKVISDSDVSPERDRHKSDKRKDNSHNRPELMLDSKKSGLQSSSKLREELKRLKETENKLYKKMDPSLLGARAAPVQRDRQTGLIRNLEKEKEEQRAKAEKRAETEKKYYQWGKGLKQMQDKEDNLAETLHEMSKPLARYRDDKDLDAFLRAQEREGDPMLEFIKYKQAESHNVIDLATGSEKPKYNGSFMPNRFGIKPGYRWDGVDRSNGYEKKWFEQTNARKAIEEQAYKWSTSDM